MLLSLCGVARGADTPVRANVPVLFFSPSFTKATGVDTKTLARVVETSLRTALQTNGYSPVSFNPDSPSIVRAVERDHSLRQEDLIHPEEEATARRLVSLQGVSCALFPHVVECAVDPDRAKAYLALDMRVVPELGGVYVAQGSGDVQLQPLADGNLNMRLLQQVADAASRDAVQQIQTAAPAADNTPKAPVENADYKKALEYLKSSQVSQAIPLLERITLQQPQNVEYALALGAAYMQRGQLANALMEYRRAITLQPARVDLRIGVARVYQLRGMMPEAITELRRAIQIAPADKEARAALKDLYIQGGKLAEAINEYRKWAAAEPKSAAVHLDLGDLLQKRGLLADAAKEYQQAATLEPTNPVPQEKLKALAQQGDTQPNTPVETNTPQPQNIPSQAAPGDITNQDYRTAVLALDADAAKIQQEAAKVAASRKKNSLTREEAYTAMKALVERADALSSALDKLKPPASLSTNHNQRIFAYSLLLQSLAAYRSYYENDHADDGDTAELLTVQAAKELQRAKDNLK